MSNLVIKLMSGEDLPDADPHKTYRLLTVPLGTMVTFVQGEKPQLIVENATITVEGNVYVMNSAGKTISTFTPSVVLPIVESNNIISSVIVDDLRIASAQDLANTALYLKEKCTRGQFPGVILDVIDDELDEQLVNKVDEIIAHHSGVSLTFRFKNKRYLLWVLEIKGTILVELMN